MLTHFIGFPYRGGNMSFNYERFIENYFEDKSLSSESAWEHIYRLVWSKNSQVDNLPEIKEHNKMRDTKVWPRRARRAEEYLNNRLGVNYQDSNFDLVFKAYAEEEGKEPEEITNKRANVRGESFEYVLKYLINEFCGVSPLVKENVSELRGFETAKSQAVSEPDLVLFDEQDFLFLISTKWTLRKDRLKQFIHEARFYRNRRPDLNITMLTNDIDTNYLTDLIEEDSIDRVYHVHKPLLFEIYEPLDGESVAFDELIEQSNLFTYMQLNREIYDLTDLFEDISRMEEARS